MEEKIQQIKFKNFRWINIIQPKSDEIEFLRENFDFHPLDLEDCLSPTQRPKVDEYENYLFMILTFPFYDVKNRNITVSEIDFFIGPDYLITLTDGQLTSVLNLFRQCQVNDFLREKYLTKGVMHLLYEILNKLQLYCYPMLDHIYDDIDRVEKVIFSGYEKKMVQEILIIKRNIVNFRKSMQAHKNIIKKLINLNHKYFIPRESIVYFTNVLEQTKDIWDILESQKEAIEALHNTNESLISFRLNDIMKILTIISVTLLPITLVASIFGMSITSSMPLVNHPYGFWIVIEIMIIIMLFLILFFKRRKWL